MRKRPVYKSKDDCIMMKNILFVYVLIICGISTFNDDKFGLRLTVSQQEHDVVLTLLQRPCNVATSYGRCNNVKKTSCSCWDDDAKYFFVYSFVECLP